MPNLYYYMELFDFTNRRDIFPAKRTNSASRGGFGKSCGIFPREPSEEYPFHGARGYVLRDERFNTVHRKCEQTRRKLAKKPRESVDLFRNPRHAAQIGGREGRERTAVKYLPANTVKRW